MIPRAMVSMRPDVDRTRVYTGGKAKPQQHPCEPAVSRTLGSLAPSDGDPNETAIHRRIELIIRQLEDTLTLGDRPPWTAESTAEAVILVVWLEARGWALSADGLWRHRARSPEGGITQSEALMREVDANRP